MAVYAATMRHVYTTLKSAILQCLLDEAQMAPLLRKRSELLLGHAVPVQTFYDAIAALDEAGLINRGRPKERPAIDEIAETRKILGKAVTKKVAQDGVADREAMTCRLSDSGRQQALLDKVDPFVASAGKHYVAELRKLVASSASRQTRAAVDVHARS